MAWSSEFVAFLSTSTPPSVVFTLEPYKSNDGVASSLRVSSHASTGLPALIHDIPRLSGQSLDTSTFKNDIGAFALSLVDDGSGAFEEMLGTWARGMLLVLRMGFEGWDLGLFETIALGQLRSITGPGPVWAVECWDLWSALETRQSLTASKGTWFHGTGGETTVAAGNAYNAADPTITVTGAAAFERETGGSYLLKVTPTSGSKFYLTASSVASDVFTIVTHGALGTTDADAAVGNVVEESALLDGHPLDIFRRMLTSSGAGVNGSWDDYPESWGWGLRADFVNASEIDTWKTKVIKVSSGSYAVHWRADAEQTNGWTWLQDRLSAHGIWPVLRQGQVSVRAAQDPTGDAWSLTNLLSDGVTITDDDIIDVVSVEVWSTSKTVEYEKFKAVFSSGGSQIYTDVPATLPQVVTYTVDLTDDLTDQSTKSNVAANVKQRCGIWLTRVPERVVLLLSSLRWMGLVPGDVVSLRTRRTLLRTATWSNLGTVQGTVVQVSPDLARWSVQVVIEIPPPWAGQTGP
jgi:hypothetical protein